MRLHYAPSQFTQQRQTQKAVWVYPVLLAMEAEWHRKRGDEVIWNSQIGGRDEPEGLPFLELPYPDRVFTNAFDKKYQNYGNYKFHPATHMQVADGCWHGKCTFCVENKKTYQVRNISHVVEELHECKELGFKEVFDDSGTFPTGKFLEDFCKFAPKMVYGCNMRITEDISFSMMKQAGFRMVLFGIESANQKTLDKIQKGIKANDIIPLLKRAAKSIEPHVAVMFGYPWETEEEETRTLELVWFLLRKGYAKTAQASVYRRAGETSIDRHNCSKIYQVVTSPEFWYHQIKDIKTFNDFKYLLRKVKAGLWH
jgi:radical SAM superfamily enzyme YgiQ (UPF0313 family)